jgi:tyrosyl-tRNA synthetase
MFVIDAMTTLFPKLCQTKSEARRLIKQGAVKIDDMLVEDELAVVVQCRLRNRNHTIIAVLEGELRKRIVAGENINLDLDFDVEESHLRAVITVGKKNHGIIDFTVP